MHTRVAAPLAALCCAAAAMAVVGAVDPDEPGRYPRCPVLALTGRYCPGCGGLRGTHALAHGDLAAALGSNALAVAGIAAVAAALAVWLVAAVRGRPVPTRPPRASGGALIAVAAAFTLLRNLPIGAALAP